jgi:hypothetical protein
VFCRKLPNIFRDFHGTEMRPTHGTEMSGFRALLWKRLIVKFSGRYRVKGQIKLVFPSKLKSRFGEGVGAVR